MTFALPVSSGLPWVLGIAMALCAAPPLVAADLSFNLVSIKPNLNPNSYPRMGSLPGGRFQATATLEALVIHAFGVDPLQVSGARGWIGKDRFDIDAKAEGAPQKLSEEQFHQMLQVLLAERFGLKTHKVSQEMSIYALVVGPKGTKLTPRTPESRPTPPPPPGKPVLMALNLKGLSRALSSVSGRLVMDETNLAGDYDIVLQYSVEAEPSAPSQDARASAIIDAVQEQLGLKLVPRRAMVEMIVIDHAERPTAN
ncbi:conserved exported hypothetical protein [Candidatus Sulfopaludibacter sp. SbA3]|nr:conserved exported hypothetical protein [Candidatus Sulfopaludibacter sp. SbA3]